MIAKIDDTIKIAREKMKKIKEREDA